MIHQNDKDFIYLITQPSHAWISGQLASVWGNLLFKSFEPYREVCLTAEQHDIGWLDWENNPQINDKTGFLYNFLEMPFLSHLEIWDKGSRWMMTQNKYAALLVSLHNEFLLDLHDFSKEPPEYEDKAETFRNNEKAFRNSLMKQLDSDPAYKRYIKEPWLSFNQNLIKTWDYFSLLLCMGIDASEIIKEVPVDFETQTDIEVSKNGKNSFIVDPWPFKSEVIEVYNEVRKIPKKRYTQEELMEMLKQSPSIRMSYTLVNIKDV